MARMIHGRVLDAMLDPGHVPAYILVVDARSRILSLLPLALLDLNCASLPEADLSPPGPSLRVVTYNINWGASRPEAVVAFLSQADADIVCLQETHPEWEAFLKARLGSVYPHSAFITSAGAGGIAILSKREVHGARPLPAEAGWFPALYCQVETSLGRLHVLNVHLRPALTERGSVTPSSLYESPGIHRAEIAGFLDAVDTTAPLIVAGDFNESAHSGGARSLRDRGLVDALSLFDTSSHTWEWPLVSGIALTRRYDHIIFRSHLLHCTGARVEYVEGSDHFPVTAVFTRPARAGVDGHAVAATWR